MATAIGSIPELEKHHAALTSLGYATLEEFMGAAQVAGPELAAFLGEPIDPLVGKIAAAAAPIPPAALNRILTATYALGVALDRIPRPSVAPATSAPAAAAPATVNLIPYMPPVRNQGDRGTCVAYAALAAYEHYLAVHGAAQDLAEQFLYWNCKANDNAPTTYGTWLGVAFPLLGRDGCCLEATWPYVPTTVAGDEGQGPPPAGARMEALSYRLAHVKPLAPTAVADIKAELPAQRCVAFSIPVFNSWFMNRQVALTGDLTMPIPGEVRAGGHAMCLVGYVDLPGRPELGGGRFVLRNSWDTHWGINCPYGAGYGTIPYAYIAKFGTEAYSIG